MEKITRKSLLYKSKVEYADFCINHVEGCSHGCTFPCYAMMMAKRFGRITTYKDWLKPKIIANSLQLLDKEIPKYRSQIKFVHLSFMTDPFMYRQPDVVRLTVDILKKLHSNHIKCTVLTKGIYPSQIGNLKGNEYGITLVSLNEEFRKRFEPHSAPYGKRLSSLKRLHDLGHKTWVSMEPYPTPNIIKQDLMEVLNAVSFVDKIIFGRLNYSVKSSEFLHMKEFYNSSASFVIKFCKQNKIDYHIKQGTQTN